MIVLDDIPKECKAGFPTGVAEVAYHTKNEIDAFIAGLNYAEDIDVFASEPFEREGLWVVRVQIGDWFDGEEGDDGSRGRPREDSSELEKEPYIIPTVTVCFPFRLGWRDDLAKIEEVAKGFGGKVGNKGANFGVVDVELRFHSAEQARTAEKAFNSLGISGLESCVG